jgi:hypothetical protein
MLSMLLPCDGSGIINVGACFDCHGNVFTGRCLAVDNFSGLIISILIFNAIIIKENTITDLKMLIKPALRTWESANR